MSDSNLPHQKNVPGPFYVVDGCCTACGVPLSEAPDLFTYDEKHHCFVQQQPCSKDELNRLFSTVRAAELECIRYRGNDSEILRRFAELGEPHLCDVSPPAHIQPVVRDRVTFEIDAAGTKFSSARDLTQSFREYLLNLNLERQKLGLGSRFRYEILSVVGNANTVSLKYSWSLKSLRLQSQTHTLEFSVAEPAANRWLVHHFSADTVGGRGVTAHLVDWLQGIEAVSDSRWHSAEEWAAGGPGQEFPW